MSDDTTNPKAAFGAAKAFFFGIPWSAIVWLGNVMAGGAYKYGVYNYRDTKIAASTYHDAIMRHFLLWADGEDTDRESGAPHLAHIMACCALYLDAYENGMATDDRSKTGQIHRLLQDSAETFADFKATHDAKQDKTVPTPVKRGRRGGPFFPGEIVYRCREGLDGEKYGHKGESGEVIFYEPTAGLTVEVFRDGEPFRCVGSDPTDWEKLR